MPIFREVLKKAWSITWNHKFLWAFGLFAAFLGTGGEFEILFNDWGRFQEFSKNLTTIQDLYQTGLINTILSNFKTFLVQYPFQALLILFIFLVVAVVLIWLIVVSQIGMVFNVKEILQQRPGGITRGYRAGLKFFGNVLVLDIIAKLLAYGLLFVVSLPLLTFFLVKNSELSANIFIIIAFLIILPLNLIISFIIKYAIFYLVMQEKKFWEAFKEGWRLFLKNWLLSLEMAALVLLIGLAAGLALILAIVFVAAPFALLAFIMILFNFKAAFWVVVIVGLVVISVLIIAAGAVLSAFQYSAWVLFFSRLLEGRAKSKIIRLLVATSHYFIKK